MPDDAIEMQTPGVGSRGERLRLMRGAAIPALPEPDPAPGIPHWDTMSDLELLRRALGEDRHAPGAQIMETLRVRIEQKKKNFGFTWKNSHLPREVAIRIDVKVTPNDSQVFLDDQLRAAEQRKTTWGLHPRGEEWRWVRDEVRVDVEHITWWDAPVRPVLALIINRPWAPAAAQGRNYKVAQHACSSHVQGQAFASQGKSPFCLCDLDSEPHPSMHPSQTPGPGPSMIVGRLGRRHQGPTPLPTPLHPGQARRTMKHCNLRQTQSIINQGGPDPGSGVVLLRTDSQGYQGQTLSPPPLCSKLRQHAWQTGTRARMTATRARPTHAFANIRVGEASNPGPPPREATLDSQDSQTMNTPPREGDPIDAATTPSQGARSHQNLQRLQRRYPLASSGEERR